MEDILIGSTDRTVLVFIPDPASTTGVGKTGLNAAAVTITYTRVETDNDVVHTDVTSSVNDLTNLTDAHNDWGWKEVSSSLSKGLYRLDIADAVFATGAWSAVVQVTITSGTAAATPKAFRLVARNDLDGVRLGLTALPNAAAEAAGGLYTRGTGAGQIAQDANGNVRVNVDTIKTQTVTLSGGVTIPAATLASTTNITAASGCAVSSIGNDVITAASIANAAIDAATFATGAIDAAALAADAGTEIGTAVWATAARTLTALDEDSTTIDLDGHIRSAVGLASANLDTQLGTLAVPGDAMALNSAAVDAIYNEVVDCPYTVRELLRGFASALLAKCSGLDTTTAVFRDLDDTKDRIEATVDEYGNRSAVTLDLSETYCGPLDIVPGAVVAYSQQAMEAGSTANAIRIRRASDDTEQTFALANNTVDVAAIQTLIGASDGFVKNLFDQSGNAINADQATQTAQPWWGTDENSPFANFIGGEEDHSTGFILSSGHEFSNGFTAFAVLNPANSAGVANLFTGSKDEEDNELVIRLNNESSFTVEMYFVDATGKVAGGIFTISPAPIGDGYCVMSFVCNFGANACRHNGVEAPITTPYDTTSQPSADLDILSLGWYWDGAGGSLGCPVKEFLIYDSVLTSEQIGAIERNMAARWNIIV